MRESGGGRQGRKKGGSRCEVVGSSSEILFASLWREDISKMLALYCIVLGSRSDVQSMNACLFVRLLGEIQVDERLYVGQILAPPPSRSRSSPSESHTVLRPLQHAMAISR